MQRMKMVMLFVSIFLCQRVMSKEVVVTVSNPESAISFLEVGGWEKVTLTDATTITGVAGLPKLPGRVINILLPAGYNATTVEVRGKEMLLRDDIAVYPMQPPAPPSLPRPAFVSENAAAYASTAIFPAKQVKILGQQTMRGFTYVSVQVNPVRYIPSDKTLWLAPQLEVVVHCQPAKTKNTAPSEHAALFDGIVRSLVVNPELPDSAPTLIPQVKGAGVAEYLIITSTALTNAFHALQSHRTARYSTAMLSISTITSSYSGADTQEKIRNAIIDYVNNHGTLFVVLGGDNTIVPDRDCYASCWGETENNMPTDLYYSGLDGNWNNDGDSTYGELADNVDMAWDVIVGRIPVRTSSQATDYITKLTDWEAGEEGYDGKIFLGGMEAWDTYTGSSRPDDAIQAYDAHAEFDYSAHTSVSDSEMWDRRLYRDGIRPYWVADTIAIFCDTLTSWDTTWGSGNYTQTDTHMKQRLNEGWYHMFFSGHGSEDSWGLESGSFDENDALALTNKSLITYTDACLTGGFDSGTYEPCLSEAFLRNANGGALAYIGCSRYGWGEPDSSPASNTSDGGPSTVYAYKFYKRLHQSNTVTVGMAFAMHKADMASQCNSDNSERWIQFGLNLQGDPAILVGIQSNVPPTISSPGNQSVTVGNTLSFSINAYETDGDSVTLESVSLPAGATFSTTNGVAPLSSDFDWTPGSTGTYSATFQAYDTDGTNTTQVSITVNPRTPPTLSFNPAGTNQSIIVSNSYSLTVTATEQDGDTIYLTAGTLPGGATFSNTNGASPQNSVFAWTPSQTGLTEVVFSAHDTDGTNTTTIVLTVTEAPEVYDIGGYEIEQLHSDQNYTLAGGTEIAGGGYLVLGRNADQAAFETHWGVTFGSDVTYINSGNTLPMINGGEQYRVKDSSSVAVDGWTPLSINPKNNTIQRTNAASDATLAASWSVQSDANATPGSGGNGPGSAGLVISEFADATGTGNYIYEFIELYYDAPTGASSSSNPPAIEIASFTDTNGPSPLVGTFSWTPGTTGAYQAVFTAADTNGDTTQTVSIAVTTPVSGGGTETFADYPETGSSYNNGTFTGQDGSTWSYTQCRGDQQITNETACLGKGRTPTAEVESGSIAGGCTTLSFDYMQAFSTAADLDVYVNSSLITNVTTAAQSTIYNLGHYNGGCHR